MKDKNTGKQIAWNKGQKMSDECKAKISRTKKGVLKSEATKKRMSIAKRLYWKKRKQVIQELNN